MSERAPANASSGNKPLSSKSSSGRDREKEKARGKDKSKPSSSSSSSSSSSDFQHVVKYRNELPYPPSGPFFKTFGLSHPFEDFAKYRISTLEKNFIWQPHFGTDVGLRLDLVDQDAVLRTDAALHPLDPLELKYLTATNEKTRGKQGSNKILETSNPWWLRNTSYLETNLFNTNAAGTGTGQSTTPGGSSKKQRPYATGNGNLALPFVAEYAEDSFALTGKTCNNLATRNGKRSLEVEWSLPIFPDERFKDVTLSYLRFEDRPLDNSNKRVRSTNIVTNIRTMAKGKLAKTQTFGASLVAATEEDKDVNDGEDEKLDWVRDYVMEIQTSKANTDDSLLIFLDSTTGDATEDKTVRYCSIASRVAMRKIGVDEVQPHEAVVIRRSTAISS
jgi:RNA polymerase II-associated factor 1